MESVSRWKDYIWLKYIKQIMLKHSNQILIRVDGPTRKLIEKAAKKKYLSLSKYCRLVLEQKLKVKK